MQSKNIVTEKVLNPLQNEKVVYNFSSEPRKKGCKPF
jgi:hypothetical protein